MILRLLPILLLFLTQSAFGLTFDISLLEDEESSFWIAFFGLGIVALLALFYSSGKIKEFQKKQQLHEEEFLHEQEKKDALVEKMGENIYDIAKENISHSHQTKSENQLLAITTNLIDFLRIRSKKVHIEHQALKLSNLLNDVTGTLKTNTKAQTFELIYNIEKDLQKEINSDTLNISKVLVNTLLFCVENGAKELQLKIEKTSHLSQNDQLSFKISSDIELDAESETDLFGFNYNEETEEYDSLGLFIAKEFALLMKGDIIARNMEPKGVEFLFTIPFIAEQREPKIDRYIGSEKTKSKNILLIESTPNAAHSITMMLSELGHDVKQLTHDNYTAYFEYFDIYDVILIDEQLITNKTRSKLENTNAKIVALSNLFGSEESFPNSVVADAKIAKPFTIWQLTNVLSQLFSDPHNSANITQGGIVNAGDAIVHRNSFQETRNITLESFSKFSGKRVLLVEDNIINQKVFVGVLGKSGMQITVTNHGKEALTILESSPAFDLIFMDINMPVMDGYTTAIKIREQSKYNPTPIIALSALTSSDEVAKMFTSGMNGYMSKPLQKERLFTVFTIFVENSNKETLQMPQEEQKKIELQGLDISLGISKSSANEVFYKEILAEFRDAYGESDLLFEKLLYDFRYEQLRILCNDIGGLSGTIGAQKLHDIATDMLKKLSYKKYDFIPELAKQYAIELRLVKKSIQTYLNSSE